MGEIANAEKLKEGRSDILNYYQKGYIDIKVVAIMAVAFIIGGWFGSKFALSIPQETVKKIFAAIMMLVAGKMLFFDK